MMYSKGIRLIFRTSLEQDRWLMEQSSKMLLTKSTLINLAVMKLRQDIEKGKVSAEEVIQSQIGGI